MTIQQDFLAFSAAGGANVLTQAAYAAAPNTATGFVSGLASSAAVNKTLRQASIMAKTIGDFIVFELGLAVVDDGTTATILTNFIAAIAHAAGGGGDMYKSDNLFGLANYTTARTNLGLGTAAVCNTGTSAANVPTISQADARYANITGDSFTGGVNGTTFSASSTITAASFNSTSSKRFKSDIEHLPGYLALELLQSIDVFGYTSLRDKASHLGVIAEELEAGPLAFAVQRDEEGLPVSVDYQSLFSLALAGVRELHDRQALFEARLKALEQPV